MTLPPTISVLKRAELEALVVELFGENASLKLTVAELREENARLKGLKGRPHIKPSGMEKESVPPKSQTQANRPGRGKVSPRVKVEEKVIGIEVPLARIMHHLEHQICKSLELLHFSAPSKGCSVFQGTSELSIKSDVYEAISEVVHNPG